MINCSELFEKSLEIIIYEETKGFSERKIVSLVHYIESVGCTSAKGLDLDNYLKKLLETRYDSIMRSKANFEAIYEDTLSSLGKNEAELFVTLATLKVKIAKNVKDSSALDKIDHFASLYNVEKQRVNEIVDEFLSLL